jgi:DNA polymerase
LSHLHFDWETRSPLSLPDVGLDNYVKHPETQLILGAFAVDDRPIRVWEPLEEPMPAELEDHLLDPFCQKKAWNSSFERLILKHLLSIDIPVAEFDDPMIRCRYLSMPGYLEDAGNILGIAPTEAKMAEEGKRLIKLFCEPAVRGGEQGLFGVTKTGYNDKYTHPADWNKFREYVKRDVSSEKAINKIAVKFPLPEWERLVWATDQRINERGIPVDLDLVMGAQFIANKEAVRLKERLQELTNLENPNSNEQMLAWVQSQGYTFSSLGKAFVARAMAGECDLTDIAKEVLDIRKMTSKTSVNKFDSIAVMVSSDGRLRHQFSFMGAPRTGRWSGKSSSGAGVQMQNLSKPVKSVEKDMDTAIALIKAKDYLQIVEKFGQPLEVASSVVRASFKASPGKKLLICDLASIEARVVAWLSGCQRMLDVFACGRDIYTDFATELYGLPYDQITKLMRNLAKPVVLGACYQLGVGEEKITDDGDRVFTGLLGYAKAFGIDMTTEQASKAIAVYRTKYKEVPEFWYATEKAAIKAVRSGEPQTVGVVTFETVGKKLLRVKLPSGRYLHYLHPEIEESSFHVTGVCKKCQGAGCASCDGTGIFSKDVVKDVLTYMGLDQQTRQWVRQHTRGGHWTENLAQAIARDILANGLILAEEHGMDVVAHVHDEIVAEVPENGHLGYQDLEEDMRTVPWWATGLPLDAAGFESMYYRKD